MYQTKISNGTMTNIAMLALSINITSMSDKNSKIAAKLHKMYYLYKFYHIFLPYETKGLPL